MLVPVVPPAVSLLPGSVPPVAETTAASEAYVSLDEVISLGGVTPTRRQPTRFPKLNANVVDKDAAILVVTKNQKKRSRKPQGSGSKKKSKRQAKVVERPPAVTFSPVPVSIQKVVKKVPAATPSPITGLQAVNVTAHTPTNNQSIIDCLEAVNKRSEFLHDNAMKHNINVQVSANEHSQSMDYTRLLLSTPIITENHLKMMALFQNKK